MVVVYSVTLSCNLEGPACTYHDAHQAEPVVLEVDPAVCVILSCCHALIMRPNYDVT